MEQKCQPEVLKWIQRGPKWSQKGPKWDQKRPKGPQREPQECQKEPKININQHKMHPKTDQGVMSEKGRQKVNKMTSTWFILGAIFHQKINEKTMQKSMPKKS